MTGQVINSLSEDDVRILANRPSPEFDDVVLQADYTSRAVLSFYRFRQLGGSRSGQERLKLGQLQRNGIHYVSDHPSVRILQLSGIALLVLFESAANAYFFAQQSAFGLSGGLFQAAAVSLANVAVSFFIIGYWGLRHASTPMTGGLRFWRWDRRGYIKVFGMLAVVFGVLMALLVNLSAAHYRNLIDLGADVGALKDFEATSRIWFFFLVDAKECAAILETDIGASIGGAATNAMCRPFALHSLDAMVLFALGISISALAAFEGRGADASFPGLSNAARHLESTREDLKYALEDYYESIDDQIADARKILAGDYFEKDELPEGFDREASGFTGLSLPDELRLREALRARVEKYQDLLTSNSDVLRDEFGVDDETVKSVTGGDCVVPVTDADEARG